MVIRCRALMWRRMAATAVSMPGSGHAARVGSASRKARIGQAAAREDLAESVPDPQFTLEGQRSLELVAGNPQPFGRYREPGGDLGLCQGER
jgi:hypothetical protein